MTREFLDHRPRVRKLEYEEFKAEDDFNFETRLWIEKGEFSRPKYYTR